MAVFSYHPKLIIIILSLLKLDLYTKNLNFKKEHAFSATVMHSFSSDETST